MTRILLIGHSHLSCIRQAHDERGGATPGLTVEFAPLADPHYQPNLDAEGRPHPHAARVVADPRFDAVVSVVGGNAHFSLGLVNNPRRYDFVLPEAPGLPLEEGAEVIPYGLMMRHLTGFSHETTPVLAALRRLVPDRPFLHLESPPPVPAANVRRHAKHFAPLIHHYGLSRPERVWRFWRLQSKMMQEVCAAHGIAWMPVPASMMDAGGFLVPAAWRDDPTHAGPAYGHAVLDQLATHFSGARAA